MAEDETWQRPRSLTQSYSCGSGDAGEIFCDPCLTEGDYIAVEGYCQVCEEYMCDACVRAHKKQRLTRGHAIVDKTCMPTRLGSPNVQDLCVDVCKTHHPELIKYFCETHDVPGCTDCLTLNHQNCERKRIQDISDGYEKTQEFKYIDQKLQTLYQELIDMEDDLNSNLENLDKTYDEILNEIRAVRKQINDCLDTMEKQITDKAVQMKTEDVAELNKLLAENEAIKKEMEDMLDTLHKSNINVNTLFVTTKQAKQRLTTLEQEISKLRPRQQLQQYEFRISNEINQFVTADIPLGKLSRKFIENGKSETDKHQVQPMETENEVQSVETKRVVKPAPKPVSKVTPSYKHSINVKRKYDKYTCDIEGSTILNQDTLVVSDWSNNNVKLIDTNRKTTLTSYTTPDKPYGVTALSTDMIAVTLPLQRKIELLKVTSSSIIKHSEIEVNGECYGIAHRDGKLAVSYHDTGRVDIIDAHGKVLHEIRPQDTTYDSQGLDDVLFGRDGNTLIVSDKGTNTVQVISLSGQILHTYTHSALYQPGGIVMTRDGLLCVCSWRNGCIHVISEDFKSSYIILSQDKHVMFPCSITYCNNKHRLYISNYVAATKDMYNDIQVYDVRV